MPSATNHRQERGEARSRSGRFQKGPDPRRHPLTTEERQKGFWNAIDSIVDRYPDAIDGAGRHMACRFLCSKITRQKRAS